MYSLVYQSVADPQLGIRDIEEILNKSRQFNKNQGITGCLLYYKGVFFQYLEGNQVQVVSLYDQILQDPRHSRLEILRHGPIENREFKDWDMAYENLLGENALINYLKPAMNQYLEGPVTDYNLNPNSSRFWDHVSQLLNSNRP